MTLNIDGDEANQSEASGDGPVDACVPAIEKLTETGVELQLYSVNAITTGTDSQGEVTVGSKRTAGSSTARAPIPISSSPRRSPISTR